MEGPSAPSWPRSRRRRARSRGQPRCRRRPARGGDVGADHHQRRLILHGHRPPDAGLDRIKILTDLTELLDVPAVRTEPGRCVVGQRDLGLAVDGDVVVVVAEHDLAETQMTGERCRLVADAFGQITVATDAEHVVVEEVGAVARPELGLGHRHAHDVAHTLAQRPGGDLDAGRVANLGVTGRGRAPLPKVAEIVEGDAEPRQVQDRVLQDRRVAGREHEAVAVGPVGPLGVVVHHAGEQDVGERGEGHGRALMAGASSVRRVHGDAADHADGARVEIGHRSSRSWLRWTLSARGEHSGGRFFHRFSRRRGVSTR